MTFGSIVTAEAVEKLFEEILTLTEIALQHRSRIDQVRVVVDLDGLRWGAKVVYIERPPRALLAPSPSILAVGHGDTLLEALNVLADRCGEKAAKADANPA